MSADEIAAREVMAIDGLSVADLLRERDEARAKLATFGVVTECPDCGGTDKDARGSDCCRIPGHAKECQCCTCQWKRAFYELEREANEERAKLAEAQAHAGVLRAALDKTFRELKALFPNDTYLPAQEALAATPEQSLERLRAEVVEVVGTLIGAVGADLARLAPEAYPLPPNTSDIAVLLEHLVKRVRAEAAANALERLAEAAEHHGAPLLDTYWLLQEAERLREATNA